MTLANVSRFLACCTYGPVRIVHFIQTRYSIAPLAPRMRPNAGTGRQDIGLEALVAGPPVPTSELDFRALQTLREASVGTAAHRGDTERATAARTA